MVDFWLRTRYLGDMTIDAETITATLIERGRHDAAAGEPDEPGASLAVLQFADNLRKAADLLCRESAGNARRNGASWRTIGEAVGGITPQGAEHRFSSAAKERRSKASKVVWAQKERRAI
jgi:hypothetical protein